ncbi:RNA-binding protein Raly isoform X4 [Oncorhynchus mykiss]|uniref:RNA-binding protein Raly isoform X4 n=1 Tax=Oncorhynchus mykiss TaxID=8022 RepID=UPI001630C901|nr:RNA-binding protein Raly isoform X4 [Oncorhynchus mykiss]
MHGIRQETHPTMIYTDILRFLTKMSLKVQTSNVTNKNDPKSINSRVFIGNLNTAVVKKMDVETIFSKYGRMLGCSVHKGYAFVQYASERHASGAVIGENGRMLAGQTLDINMAGEPMPNRPRGQDINMAGEPKPNRPKGLKRSVTALYSGYDFDYHYYRNELYGRLFEYRGRVSPVPRVVPVKRPRMAMPLVRRVNSLPVKLLARASVLPGSTIKQKSVNSNELQDIKSELTQIKFNIDALLGRLERITEDKHIAAELRKSEDNKSEAFQDESCSDTEELVDEPHNSDVEDGEEDVTQNECEDDDMENNHLSEMDSNLQ